VVKTFKNVIVGVICIIELSGCATFKTLDAHLPLDQRLFVYSGTQLDWAAIAKNDAALSKFKIAPPRYPKVDLPLSFALDSLFLPIALCAEIFH
jgi:uncharacterized protein YceK